MTIRLNSFCQGSCESKTGYCW